MLARLTMLVASEFFLNRLSHKCGEAIWPDQTLDARNDLHT